MSIQAVDKSPSVGYASALLDCIEALWKRVYDFACALFAYFFASSSHPYQQLPSSVMSLVADYAVDFQNHSEFILCEKRVLDEVETRYILRFKMKPLIEQLSFIQWLRDTYPHPSHVQRIENLFLKVFTTGRIGPLCMTQVYKSINFAATPEEGITALMGSWEMSREEAERAWHLWAGFKKVDCLMDALGEGSATQPKRIWEWISENTLDQITTYAS